MSYVKYISKYNIQFPPKNKGKTINYNLDITQLLLDGYKPFIEIDKPITNRFYHIEYVEQAENVSEILIYDETEEEYQNRIIQQQKEQKIIEINSKIKELESESIYDVLNSNLENVQVYKDVIKGLEETRDNL